MSRPVTPSAILPQEPQLDPNRNRAPDRRRRACKPVDDLLKEFDAINEKLGEDLSPEEMEKLLEKQGKIQEKLDHVGAWDIDSATAAWRWTPCAARPRMRRSARSPAVKNAASPSAGCCCKSPTSSSSTSRPITSTPNRVAWLEHHLQRTKARSSP